jgi:hypothetical protein
VRIAALGNDPTRRDPTRPSFEFDTLVWDRTHEKVKRAFAPREVNWGNIPPSRRPPDDMAGIVTRVHEGFKGTVRVRETEEARAAMSRAAPAAKPAPSRDRPLREWTFENPARYRIRDPRGQMVVVHETPVEWELHRRGEVGCGLCLQRTSLLLVDKMLVQARHTHARQQHSPSMQSDV